MSIEVKAFYKGSSLQHGRHFSSMFEFQKMRDKCLLTRSYVDKDHELLFKQLNEMEEKIVEVYDKTNSNGKSINQTKLLTFCFPQSNPYELIALWFIDIISFIEYGYLKNDNKNGLLIIVKGDGIPYSCTLKKTKTCVICNVPSKMKCAKCGFVYYCCRGHQKQDWNTHKTVCK